MTRKICALLQKKPEPVFAMDKASKVKKPPAKKQAKTIEEKSKKS
jgi:hypothetical protein